MEILESDVLLNQLKGRGIQPADIKEQILRFKKGYDHARLIRPCTVGDGIKKLSADELESYIKKYESSLGSIDVGKFVPASGAATRMFKDVLSLQNELSNDNKRLSEDAQKTLEQFEENISRFAFKYDLQNRLGEDLSEKMSEEPLTVLNTLLDEDGLNYKNLPKGLIKFHNYKDGARTAFEEHFTEGIKYINSGKKVKMHFTVQEEFISDFKRELNTIIEKMNSEGVDFDVTFSVQDPATDTIAVDMENKPVLNDAGEMHFRPAGHGALIKNLDDLNHDYVFIKNIDNVIVENLISDTVNFKKALGGILISLQEKVFSFLDDISETCIDEVTSFCEKELFYNFPSSFHNLDNESRKAYLAEILNRPIRVAGVVKNEGEPGGGPFWVEGSEGKESMQIVESAQVNMNSEAQSAIWESSTHFNPVDIVCGLKGHSGNKFNLADFIDYEAGIITKKSIEGKDIKALELPGLWNGSMSDWITVFVEVPLSTFNPVKTVFDLLRKEHQAA